MVNFFQPSKKSIQNKSNLLPENLKQEIDRNAPDEKLFKIS